MSGHERHDKHKLHLSLIERLRQQEADICRLTSKLDEADLERRTLEGKWSLKELVCHLWRLQRVFGERIDAMLSRENPEIVPYNPEGDVEFEKLVLTPTGAALSVFSRERATLLERLEALAPSDWHRSGRHPEYAHYDVHFQVEYMMHHEAHHIYQMYQRRALLSKIPH
jgi:hypothetical protein